jgi:thiosulfate/3-mercaptopyruvate sulfurtransferase
MKRMTATRVASLGLSLITLTTASPALSADMLVTPEWLKGKLADPKLVLFHVGAKNEFDAEHIPGAQLVVPQDLAIPRTEGALAMQLLPPAGLKARLETLGVSDDSTIVVYFGRDWISPTTRVYWALDMAGFGDRASILDGGLPAWKAAGGAVTADVKAVTPGKITLPPTPDFVADAALVQSAAGSKDLKIVDARDGSFYRGESAGMGARAGHIPGAVNMTFSTFTTPDLKMKSEDEVRAMFRAAGISTGDTVLSYCHIGQQATVVYFNAKRAGLKAKMYDGSWDEWSRREDLKIETKSK